MKITFEFDNLEESRPVLNALYGLNFAPVPTPVGVAAAPPADPPQKRTRRTKAEMEAAKSAETAAPPADPPPSTPPPVAASGDWDEDDEDDEDDAPAQPTYTKDDVRAALVAYQGRSSMEKAQAILKNVGGVEKLGALPESKFAEVINAAKNAK